MTTRKGIIYLACARHGELSDEATHTKNSREQSEVRRAKVDQQISRQQCGRRPGHFSLHHPVPLSAIAAKWLGGQGYNRVFM